MKNRCAALGVAGVLVAGVALMNAQGTMGTPPAAKQGSSQAAAVLNEHATVEAALKANEIKINDAFAKSDAATMKMFIADDSLMMDMNGTMTTADLYKQLPSMNVKVTEQSLSNFKFLWVDGTTVIETYTWTGKGTVMGQQMPSPTYASTVWTKRGAKWVAVFHQEVAAAPMVKK